MKSIGIHTKSHLKTNPYLTRTNQKIIHFWRTKNQTNQCSFEGLSDLFQGAPPSQHQSQYSWHTNFWHHAWAPGLCQLLCYIYIYIYGTYSKSFFKEKIGVPWGTRRGLGSFSKPSFFKDFLFQGDVHAAWKKTAAPGQLFFKNYWYLFQDARIAGKIQFFFKRYLFQDWALATFSRLSWDG